MREMIKYAILMIMILWPIIISLLNFIGFETFLYFNLINLPLIIGLYYYWFIRNRN